MKIINCFAILCIGVQCLASTYMPPPVSFQLNVNPYLTEPTGKSEEFRKFIVFQIESGFLDNGEHFVKTSEDHWLPVNKDSWPGLSEREKHYFVSKLFKEYWGVRALTVNIEGLTQTPAEHLTSYAQEWSKKATKAGPNCYFTSIASTVNGLGVGRFMNEETFTCYIQVGFMKRRTGIPRFGDLVIFQNEINELVHAGVYVGRESTNKSSLILLTKNGRSSGKMLYMTLNELQLKVYPESKLTLYHKHGRLTDDELVEECGFEHEYFEVAGERQRLHSKEER